MANKPKDMHQIREIIRRKHQGEGNRSIVRNTGFSKTTIIEYQNILLESGYSFEEALKLSDIALNELIQQGRKAPQLLTPNGKLAFLKGQLTTWCEQLTQPGVTRLLLWQEYLEENPDGYGYTQFCEHLKNHLNVQKATMHFEHLQGEEVEVDYTGDLIHYIDPDTGEQIDCQVLVCTLPYSGYTYVQAMHSQKQEDFIAGLNNALYFFGGVPRNIKMDNLRSGVKKANRYDPEFTDLMRAFANHFGLNCTTARVRKPKDKPSVEGSVLMTYRRIYAPLRNKDFFSLSELNAAMLERLKMHHDIPFQKKPHSRNYLFAQEKTQLRPLPDSPFMKYCVTKAKVQRNYHVQLGQDRRFYSVPHQLMGKTLKIVYTQDTVEIYDNLSRVAFHERVGRGYGYTTIDEHMPSNHTHYNEQKGWDAENFKRKSLLIGPDTNKFMCQLLLSRDFVEQTYNACLGVLRMEKKYTANRLENACSRALLAPNISYTQLEKILLKGLDKAPLPQPQIQINIPLHGNLRGKQEYE
jgi:transposase